MPGRIVAVYVQEGETVEPGQALLVMEGMKMEYTLLAPTGGVVRRILHGEGAMVEADTTLLDIEPLADMRMLYTLSIKSSSIRSRELFPILDRLQNVKTLHLRLH